MHPNMVLQIAKIRQAEALKEAADWQRVSSMADDNPNRLGPRLTIAFAGSMLVVVPLVWMLIAGFSLD